MKILLIAPKSIPLDGAESIVNIKMLQAFNTTDNISVDVISKKNKNANYPPDSNLIDNLPIEDLDIIEVDNIINLKTIWQHFVCFFKFGICIKGSHWALPALHKAIEKIKTKKYDYVLTKSGPSELVGYYLKKHFGMKWVASWNDPYPISLGPSPYGKGILVSKSWAEHRIISIMRQADIHIFPSWRLRDYMLQYLNVNVSNTKVIPHAVLVKPKAGHKKNIGKLRFIHSGNLGYPRNARPFLEGLRIFLDSNPTANVSFTILGNPSIHLNKDIDLLQLSNYVTYINPVEYSESLSILSNYDVAVIIEANCAEGIYLPTKVSDFLQEHISIFSLSPEIGTLQDLYSANIIPYYAPVSDSNLIFSQISKIWEDFVNNKLRENNVVLKEFFSEYITSEYLNIFNEN